MKPSAFTYHVPASLEEALALLADLGYDAKPLAGGQSLVPMMAFRLAAFGHLVDLGRIEELQGVRRDDGWVMIGAGTRQSVIETDPTLAEYTPLLREATTLIGHFQIRNRGTIGGSLAHADPAAEYPAVALASDAMVEVASADAKRTVTADELFDSAYVTTLEPEELIVGVRIPIRRSGEGAAVRELARRKGDFALAGCVARIVVDDDGKVAEARIVLFGVGNRPQRLPLAEQALRSVRPSELELLELLREATSELAPSDDALASAHYRKSVVPHVAVEAIEAALFNATPESRPA
jgi:aerobic carbon-monoxide dehydrogenase medium subunit